MVNFSPEVSGRTAGSSAAVERHTHMVCVYVCVSSERLWDCASTEAGRYATTCLGWPPPRQNHFPKVAVTHGAPNPAVYVTVAVKGMMA